MSGRRGLSAAVKGYCVWCMGSGRNPNTVKLIRECNSTECPLHPVRPYQDVKTGPRKLAAPVKERCFECVGGDADPTPSPKVRVRDCECTDCPLHPVRPWQDLKGRGSSVRDTDDESLADQGRAVSG